jgi:hypothetical protein
MPGPAEQTGKETRIRLKIITVDETWVYRDDQATVGTGWNLCSPPLKKATPVWSVVKIMAVIGSVQGAVHLVFVPQGETSDQCYYVDTG